MVIDILKMGKTNTNLGYVRDKNALIYLGSSEGDCEWGYTLIDYDKSLIYKAKEILDITFNELDILKDPKLLEKIKDLNIVNADSAGDEHPTVKEFLSCFTRSEDCSSMLPDLSELDLTGNILAGHLTGCPVELYQSINIYYLDPEDDTYDGYSVTSANVGYRTINGKAEYIFECTPGIYADEEESKIAFQFTLDQDELDGLLETDDPNQIIYAKFVKSLQEVAPDWHFATNKES